MKISKKDRAALQDEAETLIPFAEPDAKSVGDLDDGLSSRHRALLADRDAGVLGERVGRIQDDLLARA